VDNAVPDSDHDQDHPVSTAITSTYQTGSTSPPARRHTAPTWRDPRLVIGIVVVAVSVLAGGYLFADADRTVGVWAVRADMESGTSIGPADLVPREIRFTDPADADRYLSADSPLPPGTTLSRDVGAGELLPRAALGTGAPTALVEVPLSTAAELVPATVREGSVVDVWVTPDEQVDRPRSTLVLHDVRVVAVPAPGSSLAPSSTRQVIVGVPPDQESRLARSLGLASTGTVVITRQG
jgi:hypothetical protein